MCQTGEDGDIPPQRDTSEAREEVVMLIANSQNVICKVDFYNSHSALSFFSRSVFPQISLLFLRTSHVLSLVGGGIEGGSQQCPSSWYSCPHVLPAP